MGLVILILSQIFSSSKAFSSDICLTIVSSILFHFFTGDNVVPRLGSCFLSSQDFHLGPFVPYFVFCFTALISAESSLYLLSSGQDLMLVLYFWHACPISSFGLCTPSFILLFHEGPWLLFTVAVPSCIFWRIQKICLLKCFPLSWRNLF